MNDRSTDAAAVRFPPPLVYLGAVVLGWLAQRWVWPLSSEIGGALRALLALVLAAIGIALIVSSFALFRRTGQDPKPWTPTPAIVAQGIYRYTRNPMYVGLGLVQVGLGLALDNLWIVLLVLPVLGLVYLSAIRPEEAYLERKFGEEYRVYKSAVRRWL